MCGIAGAFGRTSDWVGPYAEHATTCLRHRGPDAHGVWTHKSLAFAHTRLAVIDLSEFGQQPMHSASGRYTIVFNGEIYNYRSLRKALQGRGYQFRSESDTEVILALCEQHGAQGICPLLDGMFAFAVYDQQEEIVVLARDRFGEKPLYYSAGDWGFAFSSELQSLRAVSHVSSEIDAEAVQLLLTYGYIPAPWSIYRGVRKLCAGEQLTISFSRPAEPELIQYFHASELVRPVQLNDEQARERLLILLKQAVQSRLIADVPVGAFLSGGIDSSLICAIASRELGVSLKTFSIGFRATEFDESPYARQVAQSLGCEHTELIVEEADMLNVVERMPQIYSEPLGDDSCIPTFLVSQMAREHVTVALSGDAGDEVFAGYRRYAGAARLVATWQHARKLATHRWVPELGVFRNILPSRTRVLVDILRSADRLELYQRRLALAGAPVASRFRLMKPIADLQRKPRFLDEMRLFDLETYLPDCIFAKVDRASMNVSLETRAPFTFAPLVGFGLSLDEPQLQNPPKALLRSLLAKYISPELAGRSKQGFAAPIGRWLRGPLKSWGEQLLSDDCLKNIPTLDRGAVSRLWTLHQGGANDTSRQLWPLLVLSQWQQSRRD